MTSAERFLQKIDRLPYPQRQRVLGDTARRLAGTDELRALLDGLSEQGDFGQRVALRMAVIAEDRDHVERCLDSPAQPVRARAIAAAVKLGLPTPLLVERLPRLPAAHRAVLYRALRGRRSIELAEALLPVVQATFGDHEAAGLLSAVSHERAATLLPDLDHAVANWAVLGRRHPEQLLAYVDARLTSEPTALWAQTWLQVGAAVAAATPTDPDRVLDLLERSLPHASFPAALDRRTGALARHDPARFVRLVTEPRRRGHLRIGRKVVKALAGLTDGELVDLGRAMDESGRLAFLLHALPPSRRPAVHQGVVGAREPDRSGLWPALAIIDELPAAARHTAAERLLMLRWVLDDPAARLEVTARLDWESAQPSLTAATRQPNAEDRAVAYTCLVGAAARSREPAVFAGLLGSLERVHNDQDGVRCHVLTALATAPPWLFRDSESELVARLLKEALQARDRSWATSSAARSLCERLLREGVTHAKPGLTRTALDGLQLLASHGTRVLLHDIDRDLPRGAEHQVLEALLPRIEADAARGEYDVALALARGLGRRAWAMPRLEAYVDRARSAKADHVVHEAISLWLAPPTTRDERVALVLKADRSTITISEVSNAVAWRRTDLLDDVLKRSMHGRFLKRGVRFVPPFEGCFDRWLPRQVAAYSRLLEEIATSTRLPAWERAAATRSLARLPNSLALTRALAADPEVSVAEAAIAGFAWIDDPRRILPDLLALAQTGRARVAVPAITRAARFVAPGDLVETLRPLLAGNKITSRKEGARLLAEHRVPGAAQLLLDTWEAPGQHRDVRRAVAVAARFHLDDEVTWELLALTVDTPDAATAVLDVPVGAIARRDRAAYAALVQQVASSDDPDTALRGLAALPAWLPWRPEAVTMLVESVEDLISTAVWRPSLTALVTGCTVSGAADPLVRLAGALAAADDASLDGPTRDRPARQRLTALIDTTLAATTGSEERELATALGEALAAAHPEGSIRLLAAGLDFDDVAPLDRICDLADRPVLAALARRSVAQSLARVVRRLPGRAEELLSQLRTDGASRGLVAVAIAETAGPAEGWPQALQGRVRALREHEDVDVRTAALDVVLAPE